MLLGYSGSLAQGEREGPLSFQYWPTLEKAGLGLEHYLPNLETWKPSGRWKKTTNKNHSQTSVDTLDPGLTATSLYDLGEVTWPLYSIMV